MGAGEIRAGKAFVEVYTKDATKGGLDGIKSKFGAFAGQIAKIGGVAVTAAAAAVTASVMKAVSNGANIQDLADRYQLGTAAIQQLSYAAGQSGTSLDTLIVGIKNMQKGLGNGTLGDELNAVGLSVSKLAGMSPEKQFEMIAEAIGGISDPAQKTALAMKFFGKSGTDLIPLLKAGEGGVKSLTAEFDKMGAAMSEEAIKQAAALDDQLGKLGVQFDAVVVAIGTKFMPVLQELVTFASKLLEPPKPSEPEDAPLYIAEDGRPVMAPKFNLFDAQAAAIANGENAMQDADSAIQAEMEGFINEAGRLHQIKQAIEDMQSILYSAGIGRPQMRGENIAAMPGNALNAIYGYLAGEKMSKPDISSFGTFDAQEAMAGAWMKTTDKQLEEMRKQTAELKKLNAKKGGIPVVGG